MYLKIFCFVSVLAAVYASNFDEELPLYLSDDILISKLPIIAKRSLSNTDLVDGKKISEGHTTNDGKTEDHTESIEKLVKRDTTPEEKFKVSTEQKKKEKTDEHEIESEEESGLVFLPSFGRRTRRSIVKNDDKDLLNSESNIVFLPSFKRNGFRRFRRDVDGGNYRYKRSTGILNGNEKVENTDSSATEQNEELADSDTVNGQESGLVFLPSFGRRSRRNIDESGYPAPTQQKTHKVTSTSSGDKKPDQESIKPLISHKNTKREVIKSDTSEQKEVKQNSSDEDTNDESGEESGLVFLPSFGRRSRRSLYEHSPPLQSEQKVSTRSPIDKKHEQQQIKVVTAKKTKREVKSENTEKKKTKLSDSDEDTNDESGEESGLVFLPSFGRRSRRSVAERSPSLYTEQKVSTNSPIDKKNDQQQQIKAVTTKKTRREVKSENTEKKKTKLSDSDEDKNVESGEESGLVFLPSFGRRSRRSVAESSTSAQDGKHEREQTKRPLPAEKEQIGVQNQNSEQKKIKPKGAVGNERDESEEESGLVFLPSFRRRQRRDTSSSTSSTTKEEHSTVSTVRKEYR